ncbi:hypothetical protein JQK88_30605 [Mesorhizobium caraganae]|uniref:hypothetical protein n=1 Tax=Mesorhizobium caraganae TaxID=483206 RepID=UPI00193A62CA|nr:hypothetical protein [Mesorhizobium caraganae]MBM2715481.1 hypothetical protein [Mesorhizobium caraganae]
MNHHQPAAARTISRAHPMIASDHDEGGKRPSPFFSITLEFMMFQSRCRAMGFDQRDILNLAKVLADLYLEAADHGK